MTRQKSLVASRPSTRSCSPPLPGSGLRGGGALDRRRTTLFRSTSRSPISRRRSADQDPDRHRRARRSSGLRSTTLFLAILLVSWFARARYPCGSSESPVQLPHPSLSVRSSRCIDRWGSPGVAAVGAGRGSSALFSLLAPPRQEAATTLACDFIFSPRPTPKRCGSRERRREDRHPGASQHPHRGGDRLSRVDVVFEVASQRYPLDERAATLMAENLRVKAAHEPGAEGAEGARPVADAIELRLIEDTDDPIILGGDGAEAVYYALNVPNGGDRKST